MTQQIFLPNDRQEEVLSGSGNLVVLAGAGSGKTGTLIELLSRLLAGEIPGQPKPLAVDQLLALTFAEKAAAEMRERLRLKIETRLARAGDQDERRWWLAAYHQLDRSDIGTIHGFALKLLRRKALAAGVPARLQPQSDPWLLERLKTDLLLDYLTDGRSELRDLLVWLPLKGQGQGEGLLDWLKWMVDRQGSFGLGFQVRAGATELEGELESLSGDVADLAALLDGTDIKAEASYRPAMERVLAYLGAELAETFEPDAALDSASRWQAAVEKGGDWYTKKGRAVKRSIKGHLEKMRAKRAARLLNPIQEQISRLGPLFYQDLDERLERQGQLTFDAMLLKARKLLAQNPGLRAELAAAYPVILVDEFQDTNQVQADLLAYLALPPEDDQIYPEDYPAWSQLAKGHGRLLVFGDPKQSIYRFRGAEPSVMTDLLKTADADGLAPKESPPVRLVALDSNYRSQEGLIDFYNYFFESYLGAEQFSANDVQIHTRPRLYQGPQAVLLSWADQGSSEKAGRLRELELLTDYLKRLLSPDGEIRVGPEARLPQPNDITILLQRFTHVAQYAAGLRAAGLPVRVVKGFGLWETGAVRALVAVYAYLAGLDRELNLIAVLRSPLAGLGDEAMMKLAHGSKTGLQAYFEQPGEVDLSFLATDLTTDEAAALADLKQLLNSLKPFMTRWEPARIMAGLVEQTGLKALLSAEDDGQSKLSALERFLHLARSLPWEAAGGPLTAADYFLSHLKKLPQREDEPPQDNEATITIMTIHQAKGLGFPIVVIPEIGARRNNQKSGLIFGPGGQLAMRLTDPVTREKLQPSSYDELKALEAEKSLNDYKRLLYVAATRAKDHLVFVGPTLKPDSKRQDSWPMALAQVAEARPDLLGYPIPEESPAGNSFASCPPAADAASDWLQPVYERLAARQPTKPQEFNFSATSLAVALSCPHAYYYQEVLGLSPVFESSGEAETRPGDKPPAAKTGGSELSPAQKGLIFHSILETWPLDLQAAGRPPGELVETLMEQTCARLGFQPSLGEKQYLEGRVLEFWRQPCGRELLASAAGGLFIDRECPLWLEIKAGPYTYNLTGVMDLYYQVEPGAWRLLDYKLAWPKQIGRYGRQLEIYALALRQAFPPGEALNAGLYFAGSSPPHFEEITLRATEHLLEEMADLGDWLALLSSGDLAPPKTDRAACRDQDCPFRQQCLG